MSQKCERPSGEMSSDTRKKEEMLPNVDGCPKGHETRGDGRVEGDEPNTK